MSRYIDADALLAELQEEIDFKTSMYTEEQNMYFSAGLKCAYRDVKSQPTADVVEVRHGYWYVPEYEYLGCSECGEWYYTGADSTAEAKERLANGEYYPYCPYCGAKMDGERSTDNE